MLIGKGGVLSLHDYFQPHTRHKFHRIDSELRSGVFALLDSSIFHTEAVAKVAVAATRNGEIYILDANNIGDHGSNVSASKTFKLSCKTNVVQVIDVGSPIHGSIGSYPLEGGFIYAAPCGRPIQVYTLVSGNSLESLAFTLAGAAAENSSACPGLGSPIVTSYKGNQSSAVVWMGDPELGLLAWHAVPQANGTLKPILLLQSNDTSSVEMKPRAKSIIAQQPSFGDRLVFYIDAHGALHAYGSPDYIKNTSGVLNFFGPPLYEASPPYSGKTAYYGPKPFYGPPPYYASSGIDRSNIANDLSVQGSSTTNNDRPVNHDLMGNVGLPSISGLATHGIVSVSDPSGRGGSSTNHNQPINDGLVGNVGSPSFSRLPTPDIVSVSDGLPSPFGFSEDSGSSANDDVQSMSGNLAGDAFIAYDESLASSRPSGKAALPKSAVPSSGYGPFPSKILPQNAGSPSDYGPELYQASAASEQRVPGLKSADPDYGNTDNTSSKCCEAELGFDGARPAVEESTDGQSTGQDSRNKSSDSLDTRPLQDDASKGDVSSSQPSLISPEHADIPTSGQATPDQLPGEFKSQGSELFDPQGNDQSVQCCVGQSNVSEENSTIEIASSMGVLVEDPLDTQSPPLSAIAMIMTQNPYTIENPAGEGLALSTSSIRELNREPSANFLMVTQYNPIYSTLTLSPSTFLGIEASEGGYESLDMSSPLRYHAQPYANPEVDLKSTQPRAAELPTASASSRLYSGSLGNSAADMDASATEPLSATPAGKGKVSSVGYPNGINAEPGAPVITNFGFPNTELVFTQTQTSASADMATLMSTLLLSEGANAASSQSSSAPIPIPFSVAPSISQASSNTATVLQRSSALASTPSVIQSPSPALSTIPLQNIAKSKSVTNAVSTINNQISTSTQAQPSIAGDSNARPNSGSETSLASDGGNPGATTTQSSTTIKGQSASVTSSPDSPLTTTASNVRVKVESIENRNIRRQEGSTNAFYLQKTGQTQYSACQEATEYSIMNGMLMSGSEQISAPANATSSLFTPSSTVEAIDTLFALTSNGTVIWMNDAFTGGYARYGADASGVIYAFFNGSVPAGDTEVILTAVARESTPTRAECRWGSKDANSFFFPAS